MPRKKKVKKRNTHKRVLLIKDKGKTVSDVANAVDVSNSYLFVILYAKGLYAVTDSKTFNNGKKKKLEIIREKIVDYLDISYQEFWGVK
ncbi:hypothetical protein KAR91_69455 [Candidatus Pacearchaeota archaeon]|nr:hypothetical protein [Candidatus Pacearchaeota archaeon]